MAQKADDLTSLEPVVLPDVVIQPHPTANSIPEPPGTEQSPLPEANTGGPETVLPDCPLQP